MFRLVSLVRNDVVIKHHLDIGDLLTFKKFLNTSKSFAINSEDLRVDRILAPLSIFESDVW